MVPSLAYAPADSGLFLFSDDAEAMLDEPVDVIDRSRRRLRQERIWRSLRLANVMREVFVYIHEILREKAAAFTTAAPDHLVLKVPALAGPQDEALLCGAATVAFEVEYASDRLSVLTEPVATATASLAAEGNETQEVHLVDVDDGTIDWTRGRRDHGRLLLVPDLPPGNREKVGGCDIDRALLDLLRQGHGSESGIMGLLQGCEITVLAQLALIKQSLGRRREQPVVRVRRYVPPTARKGWCNRGKREILR